MAAQGLSNACGGYTKPQVLSKDRQTCLNASIAQHLLADLIYEDFVC